MNICKAEDGNSGVAGERGGGRGGEEALEGQGSVNDVTIYRWPRYHYSDDDPPPYASLVHTTPDDVDWPYNNAIYPKTGCCSPYYNDATRLTNTGLNDQSIAAGSRPPVHHNTSYRICRIELPRYSQSQNHGSSCVEDGGQSNKLDAVEDTRKYSAVVIGAGVILFLMVLSSLVHFIIDQRVWRR